MKPQYTPETSTLNLAINDYGEFVQVFVPSSPKMRQIVADYEAAHSIESKREPCHVDKQKYH